MTPDGGPNAELADLLAELAALQRARRKDRFRPRAYERAARVVRAAAVDVAAMSEPEVRRMEGVGDAIAAMIAEYRDTGTIGLLESLRAEEPAGFGALLQLPLIGVRDARALAGTHGFTDLAALRQAASRPDGLAGLDERLAGRVRESLRRLDRVAGDGTPWPLARREAAAVAESLAALPGVQDVVVAGAVRRCVDTVDRFDLVLVTAHPAEALLDELGTSRAVVRVVETSPRSATVVTALGLPARVWLTDTDGLGASLLHATGATAHVEAVCRAAEQRGVSLRPDGLFDGGRRSPCPDEATVYRAAGLSPVPPELREGADEMAAARDGTVPRLVEVDDVRGDLHVHSDWSRDGKDALEDMVSAAAARGYSYVAVTDHAENLSINGMSRETVLARRRAIIGLRERLPAIRILDAAELNIGLDGGLDYDPDFLGEFDLGVASIHSHMDRDVTRQTDRILAAIASPAVHVIGHLTGRIIGHRPGYEVDLRAIAQAAAETGTAIEVNGSPRRLDMAGEMVRIVLDAGARIAVTSDAHSTGELRYLDNAVPIARRGWAGPEQVVNCLDAGAFLAWAAAAGRCS